MTRDIKHIGPVARTSKTVSNDVHVSFEFFPPKNTKMEDTLWKSIRKLEGLGPDFVSVTYGAGGSTRERTQQTVAKIAADTRLSPAAHLTCIGSSKAEIDEIARQHWASGIRHIVALRGDPPGGITDCYQPQTGGYAYSSDLVAGLKKLHDFDVSVSAYPERHPESASWDVEIDNLKKKVDAGATRAITQFFFAPETFLRFQDKVLDAGINIPVIAGLMLQPNFAGLKRMSDMCGVDVPLWYSKLFDGLEGDPQTRQLLTASLASELTAELHDRGVRHFHLYTLNQADIACAVSRVLGLHSQTYKQEAA